MVKNTGQDVGARRNILDATVDLIGEIGWGQVTTRKVAERAGVNNALIHYYFGSKDDLMRHAVMWAFEQEFEGPMMALMNAPDVMSGIDGFFDMLGTFEAADPRMTVAGEVLVRALRDEVVAAWVREVIETARDALAAVIVRDQEAGRVRSDIDPEGTALVLVGVFDALALYRLTHTALGLEPSRRALTAMLRTEEPHT